MKKIAVGDLGEFWYADYKEPFVQLEGAVPGYPRGVVLRDDAGRLLCAYCGRSFAFLPRHLTQTHGMATSEYKREVGLLQKSALVSEAIRSSRIRTALRNRQRGLFGDPTPVAVQRSIDSRRTRGLTNNPTERQNKTGRCYAQVLSVARQMVREHGSVTHRDLARRGIWQATVESLFGDMESLRRLAGDQRRLKYTKRQLLEALRGLAATLGRTPASADLRRYGLPSLQTYFNHFGSYRAACKAAGLVAYQWVPRDPRSEAGMLLAWSTTGDIRKASAVVGHSDWAVRETLNKYGIPKMLPGGGFHTERLAARELAAEIAARIEGVSEVA